MIFNDRQVKTIYVKKWFSQSDWEGFYLAPYTYLASGKKGSRLYAFLIDKEKYKTTPDVELLSDSEMEIVKKRGGLLNK